MLFPLIVALIATHVFGSVATAQAEDEPWPDNLDSAVRGQWWTKIDGYKGRQEWLKSVDVPRDQTVAFALYTHQNGTLKLSAQLYPLLPDEPREVRLELQRDGDWEEVAAQEVIERGWSAHFRIENWDDTQSVPYRVRHGEEAKFEGLIRKNPADKNEIVVGVLSCNSNTNHSDRNSIVEQLRAMDPDLLFFAGDQSYDHVQHTASWLSFGKQFADVLRDRPVVTIPDDHDIGQGNVWGESGKKATAPSGWTGGYFYPNGYINMVQRCQTWHLPDPVDPEPVQRGIGVYFTNLNVGGVDFAVIEDRKFKSGPEGKIPQQGPRPDHINDRAYDPKSIDLPGLVLLGDRQLKFLREWGQDWTDADMKAVLSQTAFAGAVHLHGSKDNRLLADLDSNAWPQTGRNKALEEIRRAMAVHLCGDQHLAVVMQHGIDDFRDGPFSFTTPAILNDYYGRWWQPIGQLPGHDPIPGSPLPWTGDYLDGLGNKLTMHAYANPVHSEKETGDGFGIARFDKQKQNITFECWPKEPRDTGQFAGWPITVNVTDNDGRDAVGRLPEIDLSNIDHAVVQVTDETTGEILYTRRVFEKAFRPMVYDLEHTYTVRVGAGKPDGEEMTGLKVEMP